MSGVIRLGHGRGDPQCSLQRPPGRRGPQQRQEDLPEYHAEADVHVHAQLRGGEGGLTDRTI